MDDLKRLLKNNGADLVGYADLADKYKPFNPLEPKTQDSERESFTIPEYPFGVAIAVKLPREVILGISKQPTVEYYDAYNTINKKLDELATSAQNYLVKKGYNAYAQTGEKTKEYGIFKTIMPHKTVAVNAGLGWIGKSALFVTSEYGSGIRLTSVLTDAPLKVDNKKMASPCENCFVCTKACPAGAITGRKWEEGKERDYIFDAQKCRKKAREIAKETIHKEITLCGKCIEVCPYTKKYVNSIKFVDNK